jgi:hypothetical protein
MSLNTDNLMLEIIREMLNSRNQFLNRLHLFYTNRDVLLRQVLDEETAIIQIIRNLYATRNLPVTITFPLTFNSDAFNEAVPIYPTAEQINHELVALVPSSSLSVCSICQDSISSEGCQLRGCAHTYHTNCIRTWFSTSVRCPVCRRDIREGQEDETFSESQ